MMSLKGIKLVTFDATNTLLKFRIPPWQHYTVVAQEFGFTGTSEDVKHRMLDSYKKMWNKYPNFGKSKIDWEQWWKNVVKLTFEGHLPARADMNLIASRLIDEFKTSKCWCPAEGCYKLVQLLRNKGITYIGVISNFDPRLYNILRSVQIHDFLNFILISYDTGYSKPDGRIFELAIEKCNKQVKPSESLHIGDDVKKDYEGARAAGWHALLISKNLYAEKPPALDHVFNTLDDLSFAIKHNKLKL